MPQSSENGRSAVERFVAAYPGGMPEEMRRAAERGDPGPSSAAIRPSSSNASTS